MSNQVLKPSLERNDKLANWLIIIVSIIVFVAVSILSKVELKVELPFDKHVFATVNAIINSTVSILLVWALVKVKQGNLLAHKRFMMSAIILSILFLVSYILHHLFAGETKFGGEGMIRGIYYFILFTHIVLAGIILPFILYTAYRALTGEYGKHKKLAKLTWPLWLYVSVTGVLVYLLISPYYGV
jgi:putative membrane protein